MYTKYRRNSSFSGKHDNFRAGSRGFRQFGGRGRFRKPNDASIYEYIRKSGIKTEFPHSFAPEDMIVRFDSLVLPQKLQANITKHGYTELTPIQVKSIPVIRSGKDVIGIANTGTGKTAAFLIPLIENILRDPTYKALVITPTRELALQIRDELRVFAYGMPVYSSFCIGQSSMHTQIMELRRNPHVVIGTPGRLKDLIERRVLRLDTFRMIILDEVDQMLNMGFLRDVKHIISFLPTKRQSLFFSATVPASIDSLIRSFVTNPVTVSVKTQETVSRIKQDVVKVPGTLKMDKLTSLLQLNEFKKVIVFGRTKMGVERLSRDLYQKGFKVVSIHGNKSQSQRQQSIRMFKQDAVSILVATDVAARGLDIPDVSHVINYDVPESYEDYIHRIGRTGRGNKEGVALTFIQG